MKLGVKGQQDQGTGSGADIGPKLSKVGPATVAGMEKWEPVAFDQVRGGAGQVENTAHKGHGSGSGGPKPSAQKEARGHKDASALFTAQSGRSPKRSAGKTTPTDRATREKLATAEGG